MVSLRNEVNVYKHRYLRDYSRYLASAYLYEKDKRAHPVKTLKEQISFPLWESVLCIFLHLC